jgi:hypothetical protein
MWIKKGPERKIWIFIFYEFLDHPEASPDFKDKIIIFVLGVH